MTRKGQHVISEGSLLAFLYETLNDDEKKLVEKHLLTCLRCQMIIRKMVGLKKMMENEPKPAVEGTWAEEHERAEARWEIAERPESDHPIGRFFSFLNRSLALQAGLAAVAVILIGLFVFRGQIAGEKMMVVKATGSVAVNNVSFFEKIKVVYDLGKKLDLVVRDGECVFQIGENSLIIAEKDTELTVESGKVLKINLLKGNIIAKVDVTSGKKADVTIHTVRGDFIVSKAVFYIRSENDFTECGVKEGELRTTAGNGILTVPEMAKVKIDRNGKEYLAKLDGSETGFQKLASYPFN